MSVDLDKSLCQPYGLFSRKDESGRELVQITNLALKQAIAVCGPGKHFKEIGEIIHSLLSLRDIDYSVSSQFTGHGIGKKFHSAPWILHHCTLSPQSKMQFEKKKKTDIG